MRLHPAPPPVRRVLLAVLLLAVAAPVPGAAARAGDGWGAARATGRCGGGLRSELRLRARDGAIDLRFDVGRAAPSAAWRVTAVQERRVAWRERRRGSFSLRLVLDDLPGADHVWVRAADGRGVTCRAGATVWGD